MCVHSTVGSGVCINPDFSELGSVPANPLSSLTGLTPLDPLALIALKGSMSPNLVSLTLCICINHYLEGGRGWGEGASSS